MNVLPIYHVQNFTSKLSCTKNRNREGNACHQKCGKTLVSKDTLLQLRLHDSSLFFLSHHLSHVLILYPLPPFRVILINVYVFSQRLLFSPVTQISCNIFVNVLGSTTKERCHVCFTALSPCRKYFIFPLQQNGYGMYYTIAH